ncbi:MAG: response regulator [Planctomycetota bacterium]|nr:response regulator [Planctomycetota bacterium]
MRRTPHRRSRLSGRPTPIGCGLLLLLGLLLVPASAEAQEPIETRLEQAWRWRELRPPPGSERIVRIAPAEGGGLLAVSTNQIARYDGHDWTPLVEDLAWGDFDGRFVEGIPGGLLAYDGRELWTLDSEGKRRTLLEGDTTSVKPHGKAWSTGGLPLLIVNGRVVRATLTELVDVAPKPLDIFVSADVDDEGRVWISTPKGPFVYAGERWRAVPTDMGNSAHLTFARVRCIGRETWFLAAPTSGHNHVVRVQAGATEGRISRQIRGPIWDAVEIPGIGLVAASGASGLSVLRDATWHTVRLPIERREQLRGLTYLPSGHLVCRTVSGRLFSCDLRSDRWRRFMPGDETIYANVLEIAPSRAGGFWVATDSALYRFEDGRFTQRITEAAGVELRVITTIFEDERGHVWVGSGSEFGGTLRFDGTTWHRHEEPEGIGAFCVHAIRPGKDGAIWFLLLGPPGVRSEGGGAARFQDGGWRRFGRADGLPGMRTYDFAVTDTGRQYIATNEGLGRFSNDRFERVDVLGALTTKRLHVAGDGTLWVGQGSDPSRVVQDGAQRVAIKRLIDFSAAADFDEDAEGRLWYAAQGGLYLSNASLEHEVTREPGAPVRSFWPILRGAGDALWLGGSGKGLVRFVPDDTHAPAILVANALYGEARTAVTVRWRGADFWNVTPTNSLRYQWRLGGGPWSAPSTKTEVVLTDLTPGDHTVDVRAWDLYGNVASVPAAIPFTIEAPWYTRAAFLLPLLGAILLFGTGLWFIQRQRSAQREAREGAARYARDLMQRANVLLGSADNNGTIVYIGPRFFRDFCPHSLERVQAEPSLLLGLVHPDDVDDAVAYWRGKGEGGTRSGEFRVRHKNGEYRWVLVMAGRRSQDGGAGDGWDFVGADITDVKRAQEERSELERQIQETQKLESLGVLAGGIAHDFNNLLTSILANASMALRDSGPESPVREYLRQIETGAVRASGLTQQMLAYSGKGRFVVEAIDVSALVEEMTHLLKASISKNVALRYDLAAGLPAVMADATQIRQVVMNLITNASEALEDKPGIVSITTGLQQADEAYLAQTYFGNDIQPGSYVFVEVSDTGVGMDKEAQAKLFDPFFTTKATGRGLGLSAVLGIVRGHKGTLKLYSEVGKGTSVKVLFPASEESIEPEREDPEIASWRAEGTVLVVDDEEGVRLVLETVLGTAGFDVLTADDGAQGVKAFKQHQDEIVLVLLDMTMPRMDGEAAFRELRQLKPDVRAILMSGYNAQDATSRFAGKGLAGFIQKPFRPQDLIQKIRDVLSSPLPTDV